MPKKVIPANTMEPQVLPPVKGDQVVPVKEEAMHDNGEFGFFADQPPPQTSESDFDDSVSKAPPVTAEDAAAEAKQALPVEGVSWAEQLKEEQAAQLTTQELKTQEPKTKPQGAMTPDPFGFSDDKTEGVVQMEAPDKNGDYVGGTDKVLEKFDTVITQDKNKVSATNSYSSELSMGEIIQPEMVQIGVSKTISTGDFENIKLHVQFHGYVADDMATAAQELSHQVLKQMALLEAQVK